MTLVLADIGELLTMAGPKPGLGTRTEQIKNAEVALGRIENAVVVIVDDTIYFAGPASLAPPAHLLPQPVTVKTARGRLVTPGLCDPHTHLLWAGDRCAEFEKRGLGATYQEIAAQGGGILQTVRQTNAQTDDALRQLLRARLFTMLSMGTTMCEVKNGYGRTPQAELRLLRLITEVARQHPCGVSPTFLCHVPEESANPSERAHAVDELGQALSTARQQGAFALDVYCDEGAFTLKETEFLLRTGKQLGLALRCHAEQFTYTGAAQLAASLSALSVEHLEQIDEGGRLALSRVGNGPTTVANLLPGAALQLRLPWPDASALVAAGATVALGTDCNPGSSLCFSQPLMMSLACTYMGLSCAEAWLGATVHAALAIGQPQKGRLTRGSRADLVMWDADHYRQVCQQIGGNLARSVWVGGQALFADGRFVAEDEAP